MYHTQNTTTRTRASRRWKIWGGRFCVCDQTLGMSTNIFETSGGERNVYDDDDDNDLACRWQLFNMVQIDHEIARVGARSPAHIRAAEWKGMRHSRNAHVGHSGPWSA